MPAPNTLHRLRHDRPTLAALAGILVLATLWLAAPTSAAGDSPFDHTLLVADLRGHALVILQPGADPRRIPLPGGPHELIRLPDGRIAVTLEQYGSIALVEVDTGTVEAHRTGGYPHGIDLYDETLYVTDRAAGAVRRFALDPWRELHPLPTGDWPHAVRVLPDGRIVVANALSDTLQIGVGHHPASALPETVAFSPDGRHIATAGAHGGHIEVFDLEGNRTARWHTGGKPVRVLYAPDGALAAALAAAGAVALISPQGQLSIIEVGGIPDGLAFSPDGTHLYVGDIHAGTLTTVEVRTGSITLTSRVGESVGALLTLD
jgi:DNA-binding beta-propeller fold protein YncE